MIHVVKRIRMVFVLAAEIAELLREEGTEWRREQTFRNNISWKGKGKFSRQPSASHFPRGRVGLPAFLAWPPGCRAGQRGTHLQDSRLFRVQQSLSLTYRDVVSFTTILIALFIYIYNVQRLWWVEKNPGLRETGDIVWKRGDRLLVHQITVYIHRFSW